MNVPTFATLPIGDCFCLGPGPTCKPDGHLLRKVDGVRAEYVDGSATVPVPAGTVVHPVEARLRAG
jgi:hypothetical protein